MTTHPGVVTNWRFSLLEVDGTTTNLLQNGRLDGKISGYSPPAVVWTETTVDTDSFSPYFVLDGLEPMSMSMTALGIEATEFDRLSGLYVSIQVVESVRRAGPRVNIPSSSVVYETGGPIVSVTPAARSRRSANDSEIVQTVRAYKKTSKNFVAETTHHVSYDIQLDGVDKKLEINGIDYYESEKGALTGTPIVVKGVSPLLGQDADENGNVS